MAAVVFSTQRTAVVVMTLVQPYWLARKVCSYTARKWVVLTHFGCLNFIHHWTISLAELSPAIFTNVVENQIAV